MQCFVRRHPLVLQVFDTAGEQTVELSQLIGHDGPVWQVTWAHPKFGSLLASCSLDHKVIVWKEAQEAQWVQVGGRTPCSLVDAVFLLSLQTPTTSQNLFSRRHQKAEGAFGCRLTARMFTLLQ